MKWRSNKVVLHYKGNYGFKNIPRDWYDLYLPGKRISSYITGAENTTEDIDIVFHPSGNKVVKDGVSYDLWEAKDESS